MCEEKLTLIKKGYIYPKLTFLFFTNYTFNLREAHYALEITMTHVCDKCPGILFVLLFGYCHGFLLCLAAMHTVPFFWECGEVMNLRLMTGRVVYLGTTVTTNQVYDIEQKME